MAKQKMKMTDEQLSQELQKSKGGRTDGKLLSLFGGIVIVSGIILGGNMVLIIAGAVLLGLGQVTHGRVRDKASQQTFDTIAPDILNTVFDHIEMNSTTHLLNAEDTNIPLPSHNYCSRSGIYPGNISWYDRRAVYREATDVNEFQREETGLWEKNEREIYTGQWMLCELDQEFPTWLTIWPRDKMDKLFHAQTIRTGNATFDKRFNLSSDNEQEALRILNSAGQSGS